ncbi:MAG: hypothetical protein HC769_33090 [Cyanobacteria bacterium CRU_2_1]|nr:hypothetical protein [Cyanobacteria bacterium CRU_2_1]
MTFILTAFILATAKLDVTPIDPILTSRNLPSDFSKSHFDCRQVEGTTTQDERSPMLGQRQTQNQISLAQPPLGLPP